ncbi:MAG TPA: GNAT family N-acetyltransferase [Geminicoccaceae bacterium]|nr:GNAT family N-acetyltransferase [Geminicoccaceae bacterium]
MELVEPPFRHATLGDAHALAELINFAGEGLPLYLWEQMAEPGETAWDVGRRRARREEGSFSYRNAIVAEEGGRVVACLIGYPLPHEPEPIDPARMPPMSVPLQELENLAPGTWYVNVLATYPEHRGLGHGTRLLRLAEGLAAGSGRAGLSIIVSDANTGARRLYRRCGYVKRASRPMVKDAWENAGTNWVLLVKGPASPPSGKARAGT